MIKFIQTIKMTSKMLCRVAGGPLFAHR